MKKRTRAQAIDDAIAKAAYERDNFRGNDGVAATWALAAMTGEIAAQLAELNRRNAEYVEWAKDVIKPRPLVTVHPRRTLKRPRAEAR